MLLVLSIVLLNLFDVLMTLYGISHGYAHEVNPFFVNIVLTHPHLLLVGKVVVPAALCSFARVRYWGSRAVRGTMWFLFAGYALLAAWHVYGFLFWGGLK